MPTLKAIIHELNDDIAITGQLSSFNFGVGAATAPAIFANARPSEAAMRSIVVNMIGGSDFSTEGMIGAKVNHDVRIEDDKTRSEKDMRALAWKVWEKFHTQKIPVEGYGDACPCWAESPQRMATEDGFPAFLVQVQVWILKEK